MANHVQIPSESSAFFTPTAFTRHNRFLHAFMQDHEAWFCVQDLGRLMGYPLNERLTLKLDPDQRRLSSMRWAGVTVPLLHWQQQAWVKWRDVPELMHGQRPYPVLGTCS